MEVREREDDDGDLPGVYGPAPSRRAAQPLEIDVQVPAALDQYRSARSFSSSLLIMRSSSGGTSGFKRTGGTGAFVRISLSTVPDVAPRKGAVPVAVS